MARAQPADAWISALPAYAHLPLLVNEQGKKLSKRRDPVAVEMYREQGYLPTPSATTWRCSAGARGRGDRAHGVHFRALPAGGRAALAGLLRRQEVSHMNGVYIRELSVDDFVAASRPWVDPMAGEWAPGGWHDPDTGAPVVAPPAWAPERFDADVFARGGGGDAGAGDGAERGS